MGQDLAGGRLAAILPRTHPRFFLFKSFGVLLVLKSVFMYIYIYIIYQANPGLWALWELRFYPMEDPGAWFLLMVLTEIQDTSNENCVNCQFKLFEFSGPRKAALLMKMMHVEMVNVFGRSKYVPICFFVYLYAPPAAQ